MDPARLEELAVRCEQATDSGGRIMDLCPHETVTTNRTGDGLVEVATCLDCGENVGNRRVNDPETDALSPAPADSRPVSTYHGQPVAWHEGRPIDPSRIRITDV